MRLESIDAPRGLLLKLAYWYSRWRYGTVLAPIRVMYARAPRIMRASVGLAQAVDSKLSLDAALSQLIQMHTSGQNGCGFCLDMKQAHAIEHGFDAEKLRSLPDYRHSPLFTSRERAVLDYVSEATRSCRVSDEVFENLRKHCSEQEIVEITFVNAVENYHNRCALPLGLESDGLCALVGTPAAH